MSNAILPLPDDLRRLFEWVLTFRLERNWIDLHDFNWFDVRHVDANKVRYIDALREIVAIKSVSAWPDNRPDIGAVVNWTAEKLRKLGAEVELADIGTQTLRGGRVIPLPNVILATLGNVSTFDFVSRFDTREWVATNLFMVKLGWFRGWRLNW